MSAELDEEKKTFRRESYRVKNIVQIFSLSLLLIYFFFLMLLI